MKSNADKNHDEVRKYQNSGVTYLKANQLGKAKVQFQQALTLYPDYEKALKALEYIASKCELPVESITGDSTVHADVCGENTPSLLHSEFTKIHCELDESENPPLSLLTHDINELLKKGASINWLDSGRYSLLHTACYKKNFEAAKWLLEKGMDPDIWGDENVCPLHLAAENLDLKILELLIQYGANINIKSRKYNSVLDHISMQCGRDTVESQKIIEVLEFLFAHGVDPNNSSFALINAIDGGNSLAVNLLLSKGVDHNNPWYPNLTRAITISVDYDIIASLIKYGADIIVHPRQNETREVSPLSLLRKPENIEIVKYLISLQDEERIEAALFNIFDTKSYPYDFNANYLANILISSGRYGNDKLANQLLTMIHEGYGSDFNLLVLAKDAVNILYLAIKLEKQEVVRWLLSQENVEVEDPQYFLSYILNCDTVKDKITVYNIVHKSKKIDLNFKDPETSGTILDHVLLQWQQVKNQKIFSQDEVKKYKDLTQFLVNVGVECEAEQQHVIQEVATSYNQKIDLNSQNQEIVVQPFHIMHQEGTTNNQEPNATASIVENITLAGENALDQS